MTIDIEQRMRAAAQATDDAVAAWGDAPAPARSAPVAQRRRRTGVSATLSAAGVAAAVVAVVVALLTGGGDGGVRPGDTAATTSASPDPSTAPGRAMQAVLDGVPAAWADDITFSQVVTEANGDYELRGYWTIPDACFPKDQMTMVPFDRYPDPPVDGRCDPATSADRGDFVLRVQHVSSANRDLQCAAAPDASAMNEDCQALRQPDGDVLWLGVIEANIARSDGVFVSYLGPDLYLMRVDGQQVAVRGPNTILVKVLTSPDIVPAP